MDQRIRNKLTLLPEEPGCYLMKDKQDNIIYIGKAKVLKKRVSTYFIGSHDSKTTQLVKEIADFDYIITSTNKEALLLEMNLIKENHPKFNIMLRDDKSYPYLKITDERYPRLIITRKVKNDNGKYFGPYPNVKAANELKSLLDRLFPLRRCPVSADRACLFYQMGQCIGTCAREVTKEEFQDAINGIVRFFNGGYKEIKKELIRNMKLASKGMEFEKAAEFRNKLIYLDRIMEKQKIITKDMINRDIFGYAVKNGWMCVQVFLIRQGKMVKRDVSFSPLHDEVEADFLTELIKFYSASGCIKPEEIWIPLEINRKHAEDLLKMKIIQPKRGQKRELVKLACKNAGAGLNDKFSLLDLEHAKKECLS